MIRSLGTTHLVHSEHDLLRRAGAGGDGLVFLWLLKLWNINAMGHGQPICDHSFIRTLIPMYDQVGELPSFPGRSGYRSGVSLKNHAYCKPLIQSICL